MITHVSDSNKAFTTHQQQKIHRLQPRLEPGPLKPFAYALKTP
jgi:hypothetical protein